MDSPEADTPPMVSRSFWALNVHLQLQLRDNFKRQKCLLIMHPEATYILESIVPTNMQPSMRAALCTVQYVLRYWSKSDTDTKQRRGSVEPHLPRTSRSVPDEY